MKPVYVILLIFAPIVNSCYPVYKYHVGTFPEKPVNMENINSEFDDYNSTAPTLGKTGPLCFSSNRESYGKDFDIVYMLLDVIMSKSTGILTVDENNRYNFDIYAANLNLNDAVSRVNTGNDELGPYLIPQGNGHIKVENGNLNYQNYIMLYAANESGNLDIKLTQNLTNRTYSIPQNIVFLNSLKDDAYPALTSDSSEIYFCSNRDTNFDIYRTEIIKKSDLLSALSDSAPRSVIKVGLLSSDQDDKCPFIIGNLMVFASNRSGGYGGFDLYYSIFTNNSWSAPVNFGEKINTQYDEYRPIVKVFEVDFTNDFMIFSSNRPGGNGGFDLYYAGIDKMTD